MLTFILATLLAVAVTFSLTRVKLNLLQQQLNKSNEENQQLKIQLAKTEKDVESGIEKLNWLNNAQEKLKETFQALSSESLKSNSLEFINYSKEQLNTLLAQMQGNLTTHKTQLQGLIDPVKETLTKMDTQVRELEQKRAGAYQGLVQILRQLAESQLQLQTTTTTLTQALKSSSVRGRWGEIQLKRIVEMAGMVEHIDFEEQVTTEEGRPDMIVHLPNQGILPVDSKTPMKAYLEFMETDNPELKKQKLENHAIAIKKHITDLSRKTYWKQFAQTPEFVAMFLPNETSLSIAFEYDPGLLEYAYEQKVLLVTPLTLLGLLKAVAFGWQQYQITENTRYIAQQGKELYERIITFLEHMQSVGRSLNSTVTNYNNAVGSLENRLLPSVRKFKDLNAASKEVPSLKEVDEKVRDVNQTL